MRRTSAVAATIVLLLTLTPAAMSSEDDAELAIIPSSGLAGSSATVEGTEWSNAGLTVEIHWDDWDGPLLATVETELDLGFTTGIIIPANAAPGVHMVMACVTGPGYPDCDDTTHEFHEGATGTFTVTPPPTTTTEATTTTTTIAATTTTAGERRCYAGCGAGSGLAAPAGGSKRMPSARNLASSSSWS